MDLRFSVILPAYNCAATLRNTVNSILRSGLQDFEILIIDDGSTDATPEICEELTKTQSCVRCVHQPNAGASAARNRGLQEACGTYILFFDADDTVDPGALEHSARIVLDQNPDMMIFGLSFDYYFHGKRYRREELAFSRECVMDSRQWRDSFGELFACNALSPVWNKFIRRDLIQDYGIRFRSGLIEMEDFLFVADCLNHCETVYVLPEIIYRYRQPETEQGTFRRLLRIPSLSSYMKYFETGLTALNLPQHEKDTVLKQIYLIFFMELLRYGTVDQIRSAAEDMLPGVYAPVVQEADQKLYESLQKKKYRNIWLSRAKGRLRHALAVRVKYVRSFWSKR